MKRLSLQQLQQKVAFERDELAYKAIFFQFFPLLFPFAKGFVKTKEAAEEVVSDVMMNIWLKGEHLGQVDNLTVYLYRATRNRSLNQIRDGRKRSTCSLEQPDEYFIYHQSNPEESLLQNEWSGKLREAVSGLPPKCRLVYKLVREDGLTYKEVASILDISENTVDRHLNNALHKMIKSVRTYVL